MTGCTEVPGEMLVAVTPTREKSPWVSARALRALLAPLPAVSSIQPQFLHSVLMGWVQTLSGIVVQSSRSSP